MKNHTPMTRREAENFARIEPVKFEKGKDQCHGISETPNASAASACEASAVTDTIRNRLVKLVIAAALSVTIVSLLLFGYLSG